MSTMLISLQPVVPLRSDPSHRSEMVSQILFGEICRELDIKGDFVKVKSIYDNYEGWCQHAQLNNIDIQESTRNILAGDWVNLIKLNGAEAMIPFGSSLSFLQGGRAIIDKMNIEYEGAFILPKENKPTNEKLEQIAFKFLNTSYLWGGRSVFGIDCSGFTQMVFKCFDIPLNRDASQQAMQGEPVGFLQEAQPGDLAFFDNAEGKIIHVGILLGASNIIHSSGKVRIDTIDNMGIINNDTGRRTHNLRIVKRVIGVESGPTT